MFNLPECLYFWYLILDLGKNTRDSLNILRLLIGGDQNWLLPSDASSCARGGASACVLSSVLVTLLEIAPGGEDN